MKIWREYSIGSFNPYAYGIKFEIILVLNKIKTMKGLFYFKKNKPKNNVIDRKSV